MIHNVVIIGSGPAGYTAAIYAARALMKPLMITGNVFGGQLMTTTDIENFPGYVKGISGPLMMSNLHEQAERFGTIFEVCDVTSIDVSSKPYIITTDSDAEIMTKSIIIATGAKAKWLGAEGEEELKSKGISTCATCDGAFFKDQELIVVGGGDTAMEEAIFLTRYASKVTIVHRRKNFRASKVMMVKAYNNKKIFWETNKVITKWVTTEGKLSGALIKDTMSGKESSLSCGGAFIAIGHIPTSFFLEDQVEIDEDGYIICKEHTMTSVPGVFACGDVTDRRYKQAITAAGQGCQAAMDCEKWLQSLNT